MAVNCIRFLGIRNLSDVDKMTIPEYRILMEANQLKMVDKEYYLHWQAYLNFSVQAEQPVGRKGKMKPVYDKFDKFFDYKKALKSIKGTKKIKNKPRFSGIGKLLKRGGD